MDLTHIDKINILLHEYDTLREEIVNRTGHGYQLLSVAAVLVVWIIGKDKFDCRFWFALVLTSCLLGYGGWAIFRDIGKASSRIRELEKNINNRAGEVLLIWETKRGGAVTGYLGQSKPLADKFATPIKPTQDNNQPK